MRHDLLLRAVGVSNGRPTGPASGPAGVTGHPAVGGPPNPPVQSPHAGHGSYRRRSRPPDLRMPAPHAVAVPTGRPGTAGRLGATDPPPARSTPRPAAVVPGFPAPCRLARRPRGCRGPTRRQGRPRGRRRRPAGPDARRSDYGPARPARPARHRTPAAPSPAGRTRPSLRQRTTDVRPTAQPPSRYGSRRPCEPVRHLQHKSVDGRTRVIAVAGACSESAASAPTCSSRTAATRVGAEPDTTTASPRRDLDTREADPEPLTAAGSLPDARSWRTPRCRRTSGSVMPQSSRTARWPPPAKWQAARPAGCNQVVRATLNAADSGYLVTAGPVQPDRPGRGRPRPTTRSASVDQRRRAACVATSRRAGAEVSAGARPTSATTSRPLPALRVIARADGKASRRGHARQGHPVRRGREVPARPVLGNGCRPDRPPAGGASDERVSVRE